jgi:predicted 2-oxoglutarate/Fe(II)-dependent dioxygenase YbiX
MIDILSYPDFITAAECREIIDAFQGADVRQGYLGRREAPANSISCDTLRHAVSAVSAKVRDYADRDIAVEYAMLSEMHEGDQHRLHADAERLIDDKWEPNHTPQRVWTALLYLNECGVDFTGGELVFPEMRHIAVPKPGLLVASPTTHEYQHYVNPITGGVRYVLAVWMKDA